MSDKPTILVVDDDKMNIAVLKGLLEKRGYEALAATNGIEARRIANRERPDLILLDVMMPEESGFETCVKLQEDEATSDIPVIFVTCLDDDTNKINGLNLGAVDYITKPFNIVEVDARVQSHLRSRIAQKKVINRQEDKLKQVRKAQQEMLVRPGDVPQARFGVRYVPVLEAGGDFYDVCHLADGSLCYFVADVSGHDLGASFITSSLKALLRQEANKDQTPKALLDNINSVLKTLTRSSMHLTASMVVVPPGGDRLSLYCAGHPPAIRVNGEKARLLESRGDILGVFESITVDPLSCELAPGDRIYLYSDGLLERFLDKKLPMSEATQKLMELCQSAREEDIQEAVTGIVNRMNVNLGQPEDDIILLGFEVGR